MISEFYGHAALNYVTTVWSSKRQFEASRLLNPLSLISAMSSVTLSSTLAAKKKNESLHKGAEDLVREQRDHALQCLPGHHDRELSQDFAAEGGGGQRGEGLAGLTYCREGGGGHAIEDLLDELGG